MTQLYDLYAFMTPLRKTINALAVITPWSFLVVFTRRIIYVSDTCSKW